MRGNTIPHTMESEPRNGPLQPRRPGSRSGIYTGPVDTLPALPSQETSLLGLLKIKWWLLVLLAPSYPLCPELSVLWSNISRVTSKWRCGSGEWLPWLHIWRGLCSFHQSLGHSRHGLRQGCAGMEWAPLL